jgi:hypothetical protein
MAYIEEGEGDTTAFLHGNPNVVLFAAGKQMLTEVGIQL